MTTIMDAILSAAVAQHGGEAAHAAVAASHGVTGPLWIGLIPLLPLLGVVLVTLLACFNEKSKMPAWISVGLLAVSFLLTLFAYLGWNGHDAIHLKLWDWIGLSWGDLRGQTLAAGFAFYFDGLSLLWMLFVTGLACLIGLYASEYMEHDAGLGYCRFFAAFNLFVFSMSCLVMGDNLLMLFLGWEGVGLCSYLLIGYFYKKKSAVDAGMKAFVVNRIGDLGLLMGMLLTFTTFGTLQYDALFNQIHTGLTAGGTPLSQTWQVWAIPLLLMGGAFGKSAQLFFYVWLPDAMEGPTPVSALIHAATMVTAGVYLVARMMPLYLADPAHIALTAVTWGGAITAFWSATIAVAQFDIKRIMGYSTISQLGYMFAGLGVLATTGGVFHVFTHAFFKATLFLSCGAVMHGFAGQLDMRKLSGLWSINGFRVVVIAMLIGCLNLSGFPFTGGYFSKDMIIAEAFVTPDSVIAGSSWAGWLLLLTAGMTAYYTFRVFFRVFVGPVVYEPGEDLHAHDDHEHADAHGHGHGHDDAHDHAAEHFHPHGPKWAINLVLTLLSVGCILSAGLYFLGDHHGWAGGMVHASSAVVDTHAVEGGEEALLFGQPPHEIMFYISAVFGFGGILLAAWFHGPKGIAGLLIGGRTTAAEVRMDPIAKALRPISTWAVRKWYVDEFYHLVLVTPLKIFAHLFHWFDKLIVDGLVNFFGATPRVSSDAIGESTQTGVLHDYALRMVAGIAVVLVVVVLVLF
ncbi:MAG: NADH-quinone oxidoreductase subunit L [Phycisphaeraceae bacterium]|nr:MAG: NADH-quinone oxidoreductase subunit L [Phycisphaeraceae bacterium]